MLPIKRKKKIKDERFSLRNTKGRSVINPVKCWICGRYRNNAIIKKHIAFCKTRVERHEISKSIKNESKNNKVSKS